MTRILTADDVRALLRKRCEEAGSTRAWAAAHNIHENNVCSIINGRRGVGPRAERALGISRSITWTLDSDQNEE